MKKETSILIVDDDKRITDNLSLLLAQEGYEVVAVNKSVDAIEEAKKQFFNAFILDLILPDIGGIELLRLLRAKFPEACFIIFTGCATLPSAIEALKAGVYDYIIKPFDVQHLKLVIKRGIEKERLAFKNKYLVEHLENEKQKLEIILDAYKGISSILDLNDLADFVTDKTVQIAEAEKASLMMVDELKGELVLKSFKGLDKEKVVWRMKLGELIAGWVAKEGQALLVTDIDSDPRFKLYPKGPRYKTKSFISLPLKTDSRVIGVMNVTDKLAQTQIFTEEDVRYLSLLAHQAVAQIENIRLCEELSSLAVTDALTGLFNHRYFQDKLSSEIVRAKRYKHLLTLVMVDIDSFKTYNDRYGHLEGDRVLKQVAGIMRECTREVDIVSRYGGEEFMIILPETGLQGAKTMAEKIRKSVEKKKITISAGIAGYKEDLSKDDLISQADQALYKAKAKGKNKSCIFE